jgi:hypothetical protein
MLVVTLILISSLTGCAHRGYQKPSREHIKMCTPILEDILHVQRERERINRKMERTARRLKRGKIKLSDFNPLLSEWTYLQDTLSENVIALYNEAERKGCL